MGGGIFVRHKILIASQLSLYKDKMVSVESSGCFSGTVDKRDHIKQTAGCALYVNLVIRYRCCLGETFKAFLRRWSLLFGCQLVWNVPRRLTGKLKCWLLSIFIKAQFPSMPSTCQLQGDTLADTSVLWSEALGLIDGNSTHHWITTWLNANVMTVSFTVWIYSHFKQPFYI